MKIGLIGAGNMGAALARGLDVPLVVFDVDGARAGGLADAVGGSTAESGRSLAEQVDLVILAHKPAQLGEVAADLAGAVKAVASILGGTALADIEAAYPGIPVYRFMPNIPAELGQGILCYAPGSRAADGPTSELLEAFGAAGTVIELPEAQIEAATALMGCGPAFFALVVEALVDAGVRHGLPPELAAQMAVGTMAGTASVLEAGDLDTRELRRRVTSPGGSTARGLAALERGGLRAAFDEAVAAVASPPKG
jgi:pyrroline-5-carboxylate reductase